jgi:hypothetical protein
MKKKKISNIKICKTSRNTLEFLQETQKYIRDICRYDNKEVRIAPKKLGKTSSEVRLNRRNSQFCRSLDYDGKDEGIFMRKRRRKIVKLDLNGGDKRLVVGKGMKNDKGEAQSLVKFYLKRHCHYTAKKSPVLKQHLLNSS